MPPSRKQLKEFRMSELEKNKLIYHRFIQEIFNEGHFDKIEELVSPSYILRDAPPGTPIGPEAIKQSVLMFRTAFPDLKITIEELIAEGSTLAARSVLKGTHRGSIFGIAGTGKTVCMPSLTMVRIIAGRLCESWVRSDVMGLMKQLGHEQG